MSWILSLLMLFQIGLPFPGPGAASGGGFPIISGINFHWEADCITFVSSVCGTPSNGSTISAFADQSASANNGTVAAGTCTFNTNQINSLPAVTFSSCHVTFASAFGLVPADGGTVLVLLKFTDSATKQTFITGPASGTSPGYWGASFCSSSNKEQGMDSEGSANLGCGTVSSDTSFHQINLRIPSGTNPLLFRLGEAADTCVGGCNSTSWSSGFTGIGWNQKAPTENFSGQLVGVVGADHTLSLSEVQQVEAYWLAKYGV